MKSLGSLTARYNIAPHNIKKTAKVKDEAGQMAESQAHGMNEMSIFQRLLSLEEFKQQDATLPCNTLPLAENRRFYGRRDIFQKLDDHLISGDAASHLSSIALYGLGGIGKPQIALAYAYHKLDDLDAIFWISAENQFSIQQSFTKAAVDALKLEKASPQAHRENVVLVLDWLQKTCNALSPFIPTSILTWY